MDRRSGGMRDLFITGGGPYKLPIKSNVAILNIGSTAGLSLNLVLSWMSGARFGSFVRQRFFHQGVKGVTECVLDFGWKGRTRVSIELMEERQSIYTGVKGGLGRDAS